MAWIAGSFRSSAIVSLESDPLFGLTRTSQALVAWRIREKAVSVRLAAPRLAEHGAAGQAHQQSNGEK